MSVGSKGSTTSTWKKRGECLCPAILKIWVAWQDGRREVHDCFVLFFSYPLFFVLLQTMASLCREACVSGVSICIFVDDWVGLRPWGKVGT